jgi:hypothetical protein
MTLAQFYLYLDATDRYEGRAFKRQLLAARAAWLEGADFQRLIELLPE